jgi:hypothetical protein
VDPALAIEKRRRGLLPEERLRGLSPGEIPRRLTPEKFVDGLSEECIMGPPLRGSAFSHSRPRSTRSGGENAATEQASHAEPASQCYPDIPVQST